MQNKKGGRERESDSGTVGYIKNNVIQNSEKLDKEYPKQ